MYVVNPKRIFELNHQGNTVRCEFLIEHLVARDDMDTIYNYLNHVIADNQNIELILDFEHVNNISSIFIGELMALTSRTQTAQNKIKLVNVNDQVYEILVLTHIDKHIQVDRCENRHKNPVSKLAARRERANQDGSMFKKIKSLALKPFGQ